MRDTNMPEPEIVEVSAMTAATVGGSVPMAELPRFFDRSFPALAAALTEQGVAPAGPAFARYHGPPGDVADLEVGFPTATPIRPSGDVVPTSLPAGRVARLVHTGGYDGLGASWGRLATWIADHGHTPLPDLWEVYLTEPTPDMDPALLRTELNWLLEPTSG